ncbi:MAG: zinc ABC transporter substrate-binding protein [Proteobacteria bacterium]|nr:zinc ABC transporter substrate-binding protein [Pseudomonadota bacterium]
MTPPLCSGFYFLFFCLPLWADVPNVVVTFKPLHSLVAGVMEGIGVPELLLKDSLSPHHSFFKPSQIKKLSSADVIVWIGPSYETSLQTALNSLEKKQKIQLDKIETKEGFLQPRFIHYHHDVGIDGHFWLDPLYAKEIVHILAQTLAKLDHDHASLYYANEEKLLAKLDQLHQDIQTKLDSIKNQPYMIEHDGLQYIDHRYGTKCVEVVHINPDSSFKAAHFTELRNRLLSGEIKAFFFESMINSKIAKTLTEGTSVKVGTLDYLGVDIPEGLDAYFTILRRLVYEMVQCLR